MANVADAKISKEKYPYKEMITTMNKMTTKIKVCQLTTVHPPFSVRIFHRQCISLVQAGYDVALIAQHTKTETVDGVKLVALPKSKSRVYRMFVLVLRTFWLALKQKAEIYHFHDPELLPIGVFLKLFARKKVIYDVHEDYNKQMLNKPYIPKIARKSISLLIKVIEYFSSRLFDGIVVAGEDIAEIFCDSYISNKLIVLRNVPSMEFVNACNTNKEKLDNRIIYVGGMSIERGIREMIEAINYVKNDIKLFLIGWFFTPQLEREMRRLANERVQIIGRINYKEIPNFIKEAKIGLICLHPEPNNMACLSGRNNKLYEYMAGGLAIIGSNFPKWKEVIEGGNYGVTVNPKNPKDIALAIDNLLDNPELSKQMSENGLKAVHEKFNWDTEKEKLLWLYDKLLKT